MKSIDELIAEFCPDGVEYKPLGEVCEFVKGHGLSKADIGDGTVPIVLYGELYTTYGIYITKVASCTSQEKVSACPTAKKGDLLLPLSSTTKDAAIGKVSAVMTDDCIFIGGDALILRHAQIPGYMTYLLNGTWFEKEKVKCVHGTTIMHLMPNKLKNIRIPLPPLPVQKEIVRILDGFTGLIDELEAELAARRKQYELYRDKLLTFGDDVERRSLGKIGDFYSGLTGKCKSDFENGNAKFI